MGNYTDGTIRRLSHTSRTDEATRADGRSRVGGIPEPCATSSEVREYNDAAGVRDLLARQGDTIAGRHRRTVFHNAGRYCPKPGFSRPSARPARRRARSSSSTRSSRLPPRPRRGAGSLGGKPDLTTWARRSARLPISVSPAAGRMDHLARRATCSSPGRSRARRVTARSTPRVTRIGWRVDATITWRRLVPG